MEEADATKRGFELVGGTFKNATKQRAEKDSRVAGKSKVTEGSSLRVFGAVLGDHGTDRATSSQLSGQAQ